MRIKRLVIKKTVPFEETIRDIAFNINGLNLIVDNTKSDENSNSENDVKKEESGNSVGKTTVVKVIDLCLGAKSINILYKDIDTKSENVEIKNLLNTSKVQAELILLHNDELISLKRDLYKNGKRYINDQIYNEKEFKDELNKIIFNLEKPNPSFRQLITKFVRVSNNSEESMIKYLSTSATRGDYEAIYSFLFDILNIDLIDKRKECTNQLLDCKNALKLLQRNKSIESIASLEQKLILINNSIDELVKKRKEFSYMDKYKDEIIKKRDITSQINILRKDMDLLEFEIKTINDSITDLKSKQSEINMNVLKDIYEECNHYVPELHKTFDELIAFHNKMIQNRISFISEQLDIKEKSLEKCNESLDLLLENKKKITIDVLDEGLLDELNMINTEIENLCEQKGELLQAKNILQEQKELEKSLEKQIKDIDQENNQSDILKKMELFNTYFSKYSMELYGEDYYLVYDSEWKDKQGGFPVTAGSIGGAVGTGKKKAMIVAFDFAYLRYSTEKKLHAPEFIIHDKLENTYINQLKTIFRFSKDLPGQYVLPILRERIDKIMDEYINESIILELGEDNKFFKV